MYSISATRQYQLSSKAVTRCGSFTTYPRAFLKNKIPLSSVGYRFYRASPHICAVVPQRELNSVQTGTISRRTADLNQALLTAASWQELCALHEEHVEVLNATNVCAALQRLSTLLAQAGHTDFSDHRIVRLLQSAHQLLVCSPEQFRPSHFALIAHTLAQSNLWTAHSGMNLMVQSVRRAQLSLADFDTAHPQHLCLLLWAISKAEAPLPEFFESAAPYVERLLPHMGSYDLAVVAWSYAHYRDVLPFEIRRKMGIALSEVAMTRLSSFSSNELALLSWGITMIGHSVPDFLSSLLKTSLPLLPSCSYHDLSLLVLSFASLGGNYQFTEELQTVACEVRKRFAFHPEWGWRRESAYEKGNNNLKTNSRINELIFGDDPPNKGDNLSNTYWPTLANIPRTLSSMRSLNKADCEMILQPVVECVFEPLKKDINLFGLHELTSMLAGLSAGRVYAPEYFALFREQLEKSLLNVPEEYVLPQHISEITTAFAHSRVPAHTVFNLCAQHVLRMSTEMDLKQAITTLSAMVSARFWRLDAIYALIQRIQCLAPQGFAAVPPDTSLTVGRFAFETSEPMYVPASDTGGANSRFDMHTAPFHRFLLRSLHRAFVTIAQEYSQSDAGKLLQQSTALVESCALAERDMVWRLSRPRQRLITLVAAVMAQNQSDIAVSSFALDHDVAATLQEESIAQFASIVGQASGSSDMQESNKPIDKQREYSQNTSYTTTNGSSATVQSNAEKHGDSNRQVDISVGHWIDDVGVRADIAFPKQKVAILLATRNDTRAYNLAQENSFNAGRDQLPPFLRVGATIFDLRHAVADAGNWVHNRETSILTQSELVSKPHHTKGMFAPLSRNESDIVVPMAVLPRIQLAARALRRADWTIVVENASSARTFNVWNNLLPSLLRKKMDDTNHRSG